MGTLRVLSHEGDTRTSWDQRAAAAGDPEAVAAIREAERIFAEARARGASALSAASGRPPVRLDRFDPAAEQILIVPRVLGG